MEPQFTANLKAVVAQALQRSRNSETVERKQQQQHGRQDAADAGQLAYAACLLEAAGSWGSSSSLRGSKGLDAPALAAMAERVSAHVLAPPDPAAGATARLQLALERAFRQQQAAVEREQAAAATATSHLAARLATKKGSSSGSSPHQAAGLPLYQAVFEGVAEYVAAATPGLQARVAGDANARAQVAAALSSAFPLSSVAYFLTLPPQERLQQLESLASITAGICLFNSHSGNSPSPLDLPAATQLLQAERLLATIKAAAGEAEAALADHNVPPQRAAHHGEEAEPAAGATASSEGARPSPAPAGAIEGLGAALFCAQAAVSLHRLEADLGAGIACCRELHQQLESVLAQATQLTGHSSSNSTAGSRSGLTAAAAAVPRDAVFPLFASAGQLYHALTGELRLLLVRARLWEATCEALTATADTHPGMPRVLGYRPRRRSSISTTCSSSDTGGDAAGPTIAGGGGLQLPPGLELVPAPAPGAWAAAAEQQQLTLGGMCPVSLACSYAASGGEDGPRPLPALLLGSMARPDDAQLGLLRFGGRLYGFCSRAAMAAFSQDPERVLDAVQQAARSTPLLHHLLGLHHHQAPGATAPPLAPPPPLRQLLDTLEAAPLRVDAGTQTVTHLVQRHIDKDYEWNEWALRRRLIALANLCHKATRSAQTAQSAFRREDGSQTWLPKEAGVQTRVQRGSSVPRKLRHVTGLRGPPTSKMAVLSLELDVHGAAGVGVVTSSSKAGGGHM